MLYTLLACTLSLLAGIQLGAALPQVALWRPSRGQENTVMPNTSRTLRLLPWLFVVALLLTSVIGIQLIVVSARVNRTADAVQEYVSCQGKYQQAFVASYKARADSAGRATTKVNAAMTRLVRAVADQDPVEFRKALHHFLRMAVAQQRQRAKHPIPPLPTSVCGPAPKE